MTKTSDDTGTLLLRGARVVTPSGVKERAAVLVRAGRIARVYDGAQRIRRNGATTFDLEGLTLLPGFIDLHIHGSIGVDTMEATAKDLRCVARFLAANGVTAWLPTLVPAPVADYSRAVKAIEKLIREQDARDASARAVGLHYEGPFVNE